MGNKFSPIIIIVLLLLIIAMGIFAFSMLTSSPSGGNVDKGTTDVDLIKPTLNLSLNTSDENQEKVVITAVASTEDEDGVESITLPDGTQIQATEANYEVTQNGNYKFKVNGKNGTTADVSITVSNIREVSAKNPYIPTGFSQVEGTGIDNGFTIIDDYGNQYVWVPVESGKLTRNTLLNTDYEETNSTASALVNSVAQNYGFYVGKFEASEFEINGEKVAASMEGKIPWSNITFQDANNYASASASKFGYDGYNTAILNSYAWDTILVWLDTKAESYSSNVNYGNYSGSIYPTGTTESDIVYNICDIAGNVREWTTEIYKSSTANNNNNENKENVLNRVVRGGSANLSRTPASHIGYPENTSDTYWGFRMVLYK